MTINKEVVEPPTLETINPRPLPEGSYPGREDVVVEITTPDPAYVRYAIVVGKADSNSHSVIFYFEKSETASTAGLTLPLADLQSGQATIGGTLHKFNLAGKAGDPAHKDRVWPFYKDKRLFDILERIKSRKKIF